MFVNLELRQIEFTAQLPSIDDDMSGHERLCTIAGRSGSGGGDRVEGAGLPCAVQIPICSLQTHKRAGHGMLR